MDDERILRVRLRDNGVGTTETASLGIGLTGMRERVERLRGTLTVITSYSIHYTKLYEVMFVGGSVASVAVRAY